jgi:Family of unknown function (DUF6178)
MTNPSTRSLLTRMLEESSLVARVRELDGPTLGRIIRHIGLEDAGEIVSLASTEQLTDVFDEDLWVAARPGQDETFDPDRFALWLEILMESGERFVADKLTELSEDLVTLGLQQQVFVINIDELAVEMSERHRDVDLVEKALESCLYEEIGEYRIIARRHDGWDAILAILLALDQFHHAYLQRLLSRCCYASTEFIEDNGGLYEVLTAEEMLEGDAAAEREDRRARSGYVAPSDAASFLGLPRVTSLAEATSSEDRDPVTRAYFRSVVTAPARTTKQVRTNPDSASRDRFALLLRETGIVEPTAPLLLKGAPDDPAARFQRSIASLRIEDGALYGQRMEELAYLANVLVAGSSFAGRTFRPIEAAEASLAICNLGLEHLRSSSADADDQLVRHQCADRLFRVGWHLTFWRVSMATARRLERFLAAHEAEGASVALRTVRSAVKDQKPWRILPKLDAIEGFLSEDGPTCLEHLLDRCPTIPSPHCGPGRVRSFIATASQVELAKNLFDALA